MIVPYPPGSWSLVRLVVADQVHHDHAENAGDERRLQGGLAAQRRAKVGALVGYARLPGKFHARLPATSCLGSSMRLGLAKLDPESLRSVPLSAFEV